MQPTSSDAATLPRGLRLHYQDGEVPRTPQPSFEGELQQPSPPRGPRLRVKRRNASQFSAPTEQFLASVAAADIPLPTIEVPQVAEDEDMLDRASTPHPATGFLAPRSFDHGVSPPKTPLPRLLTTMDETGSQRRDWYTETTSTQDDRLSRPSSVLSDPSDWSDDSYFSGSRISRPSDEGSCTSPDSDIADPFSSFSKVNGKEPKFVSDGSLNLNSNVLNGKIRSKTRNDAPWSKDMSEHLWQTYQVYLQDPTVTPFRIGASAVPPEGVIHRVAREAKRSWKGPKSGASRRLPKPHVPSLSIDSSMGTVELVGSPDTTATSNSGSITPTGEPAPRIYLQWQHSSAATRNHLRELCKRKDSRSVQKHRHLQSRSPTPFTQTRLWSRDRPQSPNPAPHSSFSTKEIALSLATSSTESMQPDGPLAKLVCSLEPSNLQSFATNLRDGRHTLGLGIRIDSETASRRLGSPFSARTYGPSSSKVLSSFSRPSPSPAQPDTAFGTGPYLRSPLHFDEPQSLNGTQKRRAQHALEEELSPNSAAVRPSILDDQLFGGPLDSQQRRVRSRGFSLGDAASSNRISGLFGAVTDGAANPPMSESTTSGSSNASRPITPLLPSAVFDPPRLGSPFSESGTSNTFPRRLFQPADGTSTIRKRAFATFHHSRRSIESFDFCDGPSLQSRLSQLDQKLAEIRDREAAATKLPKE